MAKFEELTTDVAREFHKYISQFEGDIVDSYEEEELEEMTLAKNKKELLEIYGIDADMDADDFFEEIGTVAEGTIYMLKREWW